MVGADHRGFERRLEVAELLRRGGHQVTDAGALSRQVMDYPDLAALVARSVSHGEAERGILLGGTGMGMCIVANRFPGVRAITCFDELTAELSRRYFDANLLCISADLLDSQEIARMLTAWMTTSFDGGRYARRVEKIAAVEREIVGALRPT
jgi:ribose 5-phosphate isomerase B